MSDLNMRFYLVSTMLFILKIVHSKLLIEKGDVFPVIMACLLRFRSMFWVTQIFVTNNLYYYL